MRSNEHVEMVKYCPIWGHTGNKVKLGRRQSTFNVAAWWRRQRSSYLQELLWVVFKKGGGGALQISFSSRRVSTMTLTQQCRHQGSLAASHLQHRPPRPLHRRALRLFVTSAATSAPVAVATVASKPSEWRETLRYCKTVQRGSSTLDTQL